MGYDEASAPAITNMTLRYRISETDETTSHTLCCLNIYFISNQEECPMSLA